MFQEFTDRAISALGSFVGSPYFWLCLVVAVLLLLLWLYLRGRSGSIVAFDSETGHVLVSRKAINEIAQRTCDTMESVGKCTTRIRSQRGAINIQVLIRLRAGSNLSDVYAELQGRLSRTLRDNLGIERLGDIDIEVTGFEGDLSLDEYDIPSESSDAYIPISDKDAE